MNWVIVIEGSAFVIHARNKTDAIVDALSTLRKHGLIPATLQKLEIYPVTAVVGELSQEGVIGRVS